MIRNLLFVGIISVAAITPIVLSKTGSDGRKSIFSRLIPPPQNATGEDDPAQAPDRSGRFQIDSQLAALIRPQGNSNRAAANPAIVPMPEALRFDISPAYVAKRWGRVSASLSDLDLSGMRVPLVTGTGEHDLHGSASYFFNKNQRLQRIIVHGYVSDPEPIIQLVQNNFRLRQYASVGQQLYVSYLGNQPLSLMRVRHAPVIIEQNPRTQYELYIELNAPTAGASLSADTMQSLYKQRAANLL